MGQNKFSNFVVRYAWILILLFLGITVFFGLQLPFTMDTDMKNQLPNDLETRVNLNKIEKLFGGTDMAMIVVSGDDILKADTLKRVKAMSKAVERVKEVDRVVSIFTAKNITADFGEMTVEKAIKRIPKNQKSRDKLAEHLKKNELVYGNLLSKDFKHTAIIGFLNVKAQDGDVIDKFDKIIKDNPGPEETFVGGMPIVRVSLTKDIQKDMRRFLPAGLVLMVIFLFICFRQARGVLLPFLMTIMAIIVVLGLIPLLGWKFYTVTVILPVILLAVGNNYGIHIMARYQEDNTKGSDATNREIAQNGIVRLTNPVLATGVTTMAGLLCLLTHIIIPAKQLGILAAAGVAFAMMGSLMFIPAILSRLPKAKPVMHAKEEKKESKALFDRLLASIAGLIAKRPKTVIIAFFAVALSVGLGALFIVVDTNPLSFYSKDKHIWKSTHVLNKSLGGWAGVSVVVEGDIKSPEVMKQIDALEKHMKKHPKVGNTTSIAKVIRTMNQAMNDGDPKFDKIPDSKELIAQYFLLYSMSADPDDFNKIVDFDYKNAQVIAQVKDSGTRAATDVVDYTNDYLAKNKNGPFKLVGGLVDVLANMVEFIVRGQVLSLFLSVVICAFLVALLMRSFIAGIISMMPLAIAISLLFGIMGFMGIELNLITAMLSSIMVGVGIDYTIHFLWRYRDERNKNVGHIDAVKTTLTTTGRGIVFNALSVVIGFVVLTISAFAPVQFFGLLVVVSITACLVCALVLLPAVVMVFKPKFLEAKAE